MQSKKIVCLNLDPMLLLDILTSQTASHNKTRLCKLYLDKVQHLVHVCGSMLSCFITWTTVATAFSALLTSLRYIFHACERVQGSLLCFNFRNKAYHVSFTADCKIDIFSK